MCRNYVGVLTARTNRAILATPARCKSWYCAECSQQNKKRWRAVLLEHVNHSKDEWCFFTLTAHEKARTPEFSLKNISRAWDRLIKRLRRKFGKFEYCRVYEKHKSGAYHLHAIAGFQFLDIRLRNEGKKNEYPDSDYLRDTARSLGLGYMTSADNLDIAGASVAYVTKYMTKIQDTDRETWGRVRRIQTSRGIKYKPAATSEYKWELSSGLYLRDLNFYNAINLPVILVNDDNQPLTTDHFLDTHVYPENTPD